MDFFWTIGLRTLQNLSFVIGILGVAFSGILLLRPSLITSLGAVLNRQVDIDEKIAYLDKTVQIDDFVYTHHVSVGICLIAGSLFSFLYVLFEMSVPRLADTLFAANRHPVAAEVFGSFAAWVLGVSCVIGIVMGILLVFAQGILKRIEEKVNSWCETESLVDKLNDPSHDVDSYFFKHHAIVGAVGLVISAFVAVKSLLSSL